MGSSRGRVARNFIERYGQEGLKRLIDALSDGRSGQEIAEEFGVSRERVRQWKNAFGRVVVLYQVHPEIQRLLRATAPEPVAETEGGLIEIVSET